MKMTVIITQILLIYLVSVSAFEELIFAEGQKGQEMIENGRAQYHVRQILFLYQF